MFVIPCKYNNVSSYIVNLVEQIRKFHLDEKIVVVDSASDDKSYFDLLKKYNIIIENVDNKNWMVGAYWHAFKKFPNEEYYYFLHDSMIIKDNLDNFKNKDLITIATFKRTVSPSFNYWNDRIKNETLIDHSFIKKDGDGCYGPIFFCKNYIMKELLDKKCDILLPNDKSETGFMEGAFGLLFESLGFNMKECCLYGDILELESPNGKSGEYPHNTSWQFPIEKFYGSHKDINRK